MAALILVNRDGKISFPLCLGEHCSLNEPVCVPQYSILLILFNKISSCPFENEKKPHWKLHDHFDNQVLINFRLSPKSKVYNTCNSIFQPFSDVKMSQIINWEKDVFLCELRHELWIGLRSEGGACPELISLVASGCKNNRGIQRSEGETKGWDRRREI